MELPSGATVVSNEGGGNCLPAAVAQALTSHNGKLVSHRGVRRAMTHWMREQARHLQPLWDGRDTNDQPCHLSFSDYLSAVEAVGSWCGNLEVYALSRGLPANLLILDFDSETTIKFASQADSDPFVVLKYSGRHYEWIQCSPEALVDIWCHAAVGTTTGGRGGGFMQIDSASETSGPQARPSRMAAGPREAAAPSAWSLMRHRLLALYGPLLRDMLGCCLFVFGYWWAHGPGRGLHGWAHADSSSF